MLCFFFHIPSIITSIYVVLPIGILSKIKKRQRFTRILNYVFIYVIRVKYVFGILSSVLYINYDKNITRIYISDVQTVIRSIIL